MSDVAARLEQALRTAGVPVISVTIAVTADKATWTVQPPSLQAAAQPTIDGFNATDPAFDVADLDTAVKQALDAQRLSSAIVWAVIDQFAPPATKAKYQVARQKIIDAYKNMPWI